MKEELFDNKYVMDFEEALDLIKTYFNTYLPSFELVDEYNKSTGYWGIKYAYQESTVSIVCGRGFVENEVLLDGKEFSLWQFDRQIVKAEIASKKNILFILDVLKRLFG